MAEIAPAQRLGTPQKHLPTCAKHNGLIDIFCEDCDEFMCTDCAKTDHRNHNWGTVVKAASQRRRQLVGFIQTIREEKVPEIDRKIEETPLNVKEIENQGDHEIQKVRKHFDEIISRLTEIKSQHERTLRDNVIKRCEQVNRLKTRYEEQKKNLVEMVKWMEDNNGTVSDYKFINHHREMSKLVSSVDVDKAICEFSLRFTSSELNDEDIGSLAGQMFDLEDFRATERSIFKYSEEAVSNLEAISENESYIKFFESKYIERINKEGGEINKCNVTAKDICITDTGAVYFTDYNRKTITRWSPFGPVSTASIGPLAPVGICQSVYGSLFVTLGDTKSELYRLDSSSRRLVRHVSFTGNVIREYEYQEDGQTRLFTVPFRVQQNGNSDICVVNRTSNTTGNVVILSSAGRLRSVYHGQNLKEDFFPSDLVCDPRSDIVVTDYYNHRIHLLSPDGEFLKFLLTENEVHSPTALSLSGSTLWVGNSEGYVKLFQFEI